MPKIFLKARDPMSSYTHFLGVILSAAGIIFMLARGISQTFSGATVTGIIFCLSLMGLYSASSLYHFTTVSEKVIANLRKLDHSMIYVLIAGSYTPLLYNVLPAPRGTVLLILIWSIAAAGIILKLCWMNIPRWFSTALYILMGWFIAIDFRALTLLTPEVLFFLIAGGISYTAGGVIYGLKKPNISETFGFHEIFHIFVLMGSIFHYFMVLLIIG